MIKPAGAMEPYSDRKLPGLDILRVVAISFVFVYHYGRLFPHPNWTNTTSKFGWTGVDLFFVLSGFLIASPIFEKIASGNFFSMREFFLKRLFRIVPAYLVVLFLYYFFPILTERSELAPIWRYLSFTQNFGLDLQKEGAFSHAWSLCIEEQFYFLFPIILFILVYIKAIKQGIWILITLFVFGFFLRYYSDKYLVLPFLHEEGGWANWNKWVYYPTYCRMDGLITGVGVAALFQFRPLLKARILQCGNWLLISGICILTSAYFLCLDEQSLKASVFGFPVVSIGYGFMVMGAVSPKSVLFNLKSKFASELAVLSYATYLLHKMVVHISQEVFSKIHIEKEGNFMLLICLITTIGSRPFDKQVN